VLLYSRYGVQPIPILGACPDVIVSAQDSSRRSAQVLRRRRRCSGLHIVGAFASISGGRLVGCGYEFGTAALFFTRNGRRLPNAFVGVYMPRVEHDVYAAIGLENTNEVEVNFGAASFQWRKRNDVAWRVDNHVGRMVGSGGPGEDERLPSYSEARRRYVDGMTRQSVYTGRGPR